jgi:hypothetical protein
MSVWQARKRGQDFNAHALMFDEFKAVKVFPLSMLLKPNLLFFTLNFSYLLYPF